MTDLIKVALLGDGAAAVGAAVLDVLEEASFPSDPRRAVQTLAEDGADLRATAGQLARVEADVTHVVLSVGGADSLAQRTTLASVPATSVAQALGTLARVQQDFATQYDAVVSSIKAAGLPLLLLIPYDAKFAAEADAAVARAALSMFADVVYRAAGRHGCSVLDLRLLFDDDGDWVSPVVPSAQGASKIAHKVVEFLIRRAGEGRKPSAVAGAGGGAGGAAAPVIAVPAMFAGTAPAAGGVAAPV